jgi:glycosyltransferase involved in cell wall biosynthesis
VQGTSLDKLGYIPVLFAKWAFKIPAAVYVFDVFTLPQHYYLVSPQINPFKKFSRVLNFIYHVYLSFSTWFRYMFFLRIFDLILTTSEHASQLLKKTIYERDVKIETIGVPISTPSIEGVAIENAPLVINIARLSKDKNPDLFIGIAKAVRNMRSDVRFVWIGGGYECHRYQELSNGLVDFLGSVTENEKWRWLEKCWMLLQTGHLHYAGFNIPIGEALLLSKPVISIRNDVINSLYGPFVVFIDENDTIQAVHAIFHVLSHYKSYVEIASKGSEYVKKSFSPETVASKLEDALRRTLNSDFPEKMLKLKKAKEE